VNQPFLAFPVYKNALEFVRDVNLLCRGVNGMEFYFLKDQIRRASSSIVLNISEGSGKWTKRDKINFYRIARASAFECIGALDLFEANQLSNHEQIMILKNKANNISGELQAMIFSIEKRKI